MKMTTLAFPVTLWGILAEKRERKGGKGRKKRREGETLRSRCHPTNLQPVQIPSPIYIFRNPSILRNAPSKVGRERGISH